jgi:hypothetical protein
MTFSSIDTVDVAIQWIRVAREIPPGGNAEVARAVT